MQLDAFCDFVDDAVQLDFFKILVRTDLYAPQVQQAGDELGDVVDAGLDAFDELFLFVVDGSNAFDEFDIAQDGGEGRTQVMRDNADKIIMLEEDQIDGAEIVVISYGITSRVSIRAVQLARKAGMKIGTMRLKTVWPFPEKRIKQLAKKIKAFVVPEINYGQVVLEVERCAAGKAATYHVPHMGGWVHDPNDILKVIKEAAK